MIAAGSTSQRRRRGSQLAAEVRARGMHAREGYAWAVARVRAYDYNDDDDENSPESMNL